MVMHMNIRGLGWCFVLWVLPVACGGGTGGGSSGASGSSGAATSNGGSSPGAGGASAGASGASANAGSGGAAPAPCTGKCPVDLITNIQAPWGLAVDSSFAYVLLLSDSTVMRAPLAGGAAVQVTSVLYGSAGTDGLVVDATNVYLTNTGGGTDPGVLKAPLAGGTATYLAKDIDDPEMLRLDSKNVYWPSPNTIYGVPLAGGDSIPLAQEMLTSPNRIAIDATYIYWSEDAGFSGDSVKRVALAGGGAIETLAANLSPVEDLEVDDANVYILADADLLKIPLAGGDAVPVVVGLGSSFVLDGEQVYATNGTTVVQVAKSGGNPTTLATGQTSATSIIVDATTIYWLDRGSLLAPDGAVRKLAK